MRIDIWSDVVCPWCYIGKRRLEEALADFPQAEQVELVWHSYQLDPGTPRDTTEPVDEHLGRKYGGGVEAGRRMIDQMEAVAAELGLIFRLHQAKRANTVDAHRLLHLALETGGPVQQDRLKEALLAAYFTEVRDVADAGVLREIALAVGLDGDRVDAVLDSEEYADQVQADIDQAHAYGVTGVPFFVVDGRYGIAGAQPPEVFAQALRQAWGERQPELQMVGAAGEADAAGHGEVCGPDGCTP